MYMLRTEIRKLGGLICFLFVMLAILAQQYTVTGGNGVPGPMPFAYIDTIDD